MATFREYLEARKSRFEGLADKANPKDEPVYRAYAREDALIIVAMNTCQWDDVKPLCPNCGTDIAAWESPEAFNEKHDCEVGYGLSS